MSADKRWEPLPRDGAHDAMSVIDDWTRLDEFIAKMPDPATDPQIDRLVAQAEAARQQDRYLIFAWWRLFFERPGGGMYLAAGNRILPGTPLDNIDAFLDEALRYGTAHRAAHSAH